MEIFDELEKEESMFFKLLAREKNLLKEEKQRIKEESYILPIIEKCTYKDKYTEAHEFLVQLYDSMD